jgi:MFS family permease
VPFRKRRYGALAGVGFFSMLAFSGFEATFSLFGGARFNLTEASTALVFLGVGIVMSVVQGSLIGPLTNRFGSFRLLRNGLLLVSIGMLFLGAAVIWPTLIVALLFMVVGAGISSPSLTALVADSADDDRRGEALGIQQSATALARVVGPPLAGLAFDHVGIGAPYTFGALIYVFAIGIAFRKLK